MKRKKSFLSASLKRSYEKSPKPVLFITKSFRPFYYNEKMRFVAEELCSPTTILSLLTDESRRRFRSYDGNRPLLLATRRENYFFTAEGVFDGEKAACYKITVGGFDDMAFLSGVSDERFRISKAVADGFTKTLQNAAEKLNEITTGDISLRLHGEISEVSQKVSDLSGLSVSLAEIVGKATEFSSSNKRFFRVTELVAYLSQSIPCVTLPKDFDDKDDRSVVFCPKSGVAETLLRCCRFITASADRNVRIRTEISYRLEKIVLKFSANVGKNNFADPFAPSFGSGGIFNFGLRDARTFIEEQGGNLLVTEYKNRLSVFISFPTVDISAVPSGIFDSMDSGFETLTFDLEEYSNAVKYLR